MEPFNKFYEEWDGTQNQMHQKPMERFVKILTDRYLETKKPLSIVDLGCGYGKQAYNIKKKLEYNGVQIDIFYGYDISPELIDIANQKYSSENMKFFRGLRMKRKMSSTAVVVQKQIVFDDST